MTTLTAEELQSVYTWVDGIPLSRPKKNIARDFTDGGVCLFCVFLWRLGDGERSALIEALCAQF